jgi:carnitine O-acetyltransferase
LQHWWNTLGYLDVRESLVINVSYYFHFADDPTVFTTTTATRSSSSSSIHINSNNGTTATTSTATSSTPQVKRAAALLYTAAQVRQQVVTGQWPAETIGKQQTALCATAYKYLFHACRIPGSPRDSYRMYDPALFHHAAVAVQGQIYAIPLVDPVSHAPLPLSILEESLTACLNQQQQATRPIAANGLTWLTSWNRDDWATAHQILTQDAPMRQALQVLESAACLVCLDDVAIHAVRDMAHLLLHGQASATETPTTTTTTAAAVGSSPSQSSPVMNSMNPINHPINRWFDKSLQFIVTRNAKAGLLGEHSMMDGMPVVRLADRLASQSYQTCVKASAQAQAQTAKDSPSPCSVSPSATPIFGRDCQATLPQVSPLIRQAKDDFNSWVGQHDIQTLRFGTYGSAWIKKRAGLSPDAYVQAVLQLATYRLWEGTQGGTYEATQVRPFLHGRTETTRAVSTESAALVQCFGTEPLWHEAQDAKARSHKLQLLRDATVAHVTYIKNASQAQGVDRHFLGLSLAAQTGERLPDLYQDPLFAKSKRWRVSTSHLTHPRFVNWGYGEVVPDGVGLSYSIHPTHINFSVTALKEHDWVERLCYHLEQALLEFQLLVEADAPAATPTSRL